jgi:hypothetical protein
LAFIKKNCFTILLLITGIAKIFSQDTLIMKSGKIIPAKVLEIAPTEIKYNRFDYLNGPVIVLLKTDLSEIIYENGKRVSILEEVKREDSLYEKSGSDQFSKGQRDAEIYYRGYNSAGTVYISYQLTFSTCRNNTRNCLFKYNTKS